MRTEEEETCDHGEKQEAESYLVTLSEAAQGLINKNKNKKDFRNEVEIFQDKQFEMLRE